MAVSGDYGTGRYGGGRYGIGDFIFNPNATQSYQSRFKDDKGRGASQTAQEEMFLRGKKR